MAFFIINKESQEFHLFGSLPRMIEKFNLSKVKLEYHFSRKKETKMEDDLYLIYKIKLKRGGKKKL